MHVRRFSTSVEVLTPAKLNLFLEVLGKRADGFHEIETLIIGVGLYDSLTFTPTNGSDIRLDCRWAAGLVPSKANVTDQTASPHEALYGDIPTGPKNLVWRAVELVRDRAKIQSGVEIQLVKRIPAAAGLGGGSSDSAAALIAANEAWQLNWPRERLVSLAAELGSDVPFFLTGGAAVCRGRGERIEPTTSRRLHVVVVRPPVGVGTAEVYKACQPAERPESVERIQAALAHGNAAELGQLMVNRLQPAASGITPWIGKLRERFGREAILGHQMSGSGSSYFGICRSARSARRVAARLRARGCGAVFAATTTVG